MHRGFQTISRARTRDAQEKSEELEEMEDKKTWKLRERKNSDS